MNAVAQTAATAATAADVGSRAIAQIKALELLWQTAQHDYGGSRVCVKLLLGLYNGKRFPFELTELRCLDYQHLEAALLVLRMDARPAMEVHELLNQLHGTTNMGPRFELLACDWRLKGRCTKQYERELRALLKSRASAAPQSAGVAS